MERIRKNWKELERKQNKTMKAILYTEDVWRNSQLSIVRYTGRIEINGTTYIVVNKEGRDVFELSREAEKLGRDKAIPAGEPCDLIDESYQSIYKAVGREQFLRWLLEKKTKKEMEKMIKTKNTRQ